MERKARKNKGRAESASSSQHVPRAKDARRNNKAKKWTDPAGRISSAWLRRPWASRRQGGYIGVSKRRQTARRFGSHEDG